MKKALLYILSGLLVVILAIVIWMATSNGQRFFRNQIVERLHQATSLQIEISRLQTNYLTSTVIEGVKISDPGGKSEITIQSIVLRYNLRKIFSKHIHIDSVNISGVSGNFTQRVIESLQKEFGAEDPGDGTWDFQLHTIQGKQWEIEYRNEVTNLAVMVGNLNFGYAKGGRIWTNIDSINAWYEEGSLREARVTLQGNWSNGLWHIEELSIRSAKSHIQTTDTLQFSPAGAQELHTQISGVIGEDLLETGVRILSPTNAEDLKIQAIHLHGEISYQNGEYNYRGTLESESAGYDTLIFKSLTATVSGSNDSMIVHTFRATGLDPADSIRITGAIDWQSVIVSATLDADIQALSSYTGEMISEGSTPGSAVIQGDVRFPLREPSRVAGKLTTRVKGTVIEGDTLPDLYSTVTAQSGTLIVSINHGGNRMIFSGNTGLPVQFTGRLAVEDPEVYRGLTGRAVSGQIVSTFSGSVQNGKRYRLDGEIRAGSTTLLNSRELYINTGFSAEPGELQIQSGNLLIGRSAPITFDGEASWKDGFQGRFQMHEPESDTDPSPRGSLTASIKRIRENAPVQGELNVRNFSLTPFRTLLPDSARSLDGELNLHTSVMLNADSIQGKGQLSLQNGNFAGAMIDSLTGHYSFDSKAISLKEGRVHYNTNIAEFNGKVPFSADRKIDFSAGVERYPLSSLTVGAPPGWTVDGTANASLQVTGTLKQPEITGEASISDGFLRWDSTKAPLEGVRLVTSFDGTSFRISEGSAKYHAYPLEISASGNISDPAIEGQVQVQPQGRVEFSYSQNQGDSLRIVTSELPLRLMSEYYRQEEILKGHVDAMLSVRASSSRNPEIRSSGAVRIPSLNNEQWDVHWSIFAANNTFNLDSLTVRSDTNLVKLSGKMVGDTTNTATWDFSSLSFKGVRLSVPILQFADLDPLKSDISIEQGTLRGELSFDGAVRSPEIGGALSIDGVVLTNALQQWRIRIEQLQTSHAGYQHTLRNVSGQINETEFRGDGSVHASPAGTYSARLNLQSDEKSSVTLVLNHWTADSLDGEVQAEGLSLQNLLAIKDPELDVAGNLAMQAQFTGTPANPNLQVDAKISDFRLADAVFKHASLAAEYNDSTIRIDSLFATNRTAHVFLSGSSSGEISLSPFLMTDVGNHASFRINVQDYPLRSLEALASKEYNIDGTLEGDLSYEKTPESTDIRGFLQVNDLSSELPYFSQQLRQGNVRVEFSPGHIEITEGEGLIAKSRLSLDGQVSTFSQRPPEFNILLSMGEVILSRQREVKLTLDESDIEFTSRPGEPGLVRGTIRVQSFRYTNPIQNYQLLTMIGARTRPPETIRVLPEDIRLQVDIQALDNTRIDNNLGKVPFTADLQIRGPIYQPRYGGRILAESGEVYYLGKTFKIIEGRAFFQGRPTLNPDIHLQAGTTIPASANVDDIDYRITMQITGMARAPKVNFSIQPPTRPDSTEPLSQSDIVGILAVGRPRSQLSGLLQGENLQQFLLRQASFFSSRQISSMVEYRASRLLDLDRVAIEGNLFQLSGSNGPTFTAEKNLTSRLTLSYSTIIGQANEHGVQLHYELTPHWYISTETNQQKEYGIDLKYRVRFR